MQLPGCISTHHWSTVLSFHHSNSNSLKASPLCSNWIITNIMKLNLVLTWRSFGIESFLLGYIKSWIKSYFNYNRQIILNASFKCKMLQWRTLMLKSFSLETIWNQCTKLKHFHHWTLFCHTGSAREGLWINAENSVHTHKFSRQNSDQSRKTKIYVWLVMQTLHSLAK